MTSKIMIVDDEPDLEQLVRQKFRRQIREKSYEFVFATNGQEALDIIEERGDIDAVFSDINMPVMDGLTLLMQLHAKNPLIKSVIVSAYSDMDNIRTAMNRGAFDFICKPIQFNDLEITLEKTLKQVQQTRETLQAIRENNILRMYVDDSVLDFMADKKAETTLLVNETVEASIVFRETPDFVVNLINKYFDIMVKEIIAHQGQIDKFLGDAIMAIFRGDYHVDRAIEASLAVIKAIEAQQENLSNKDIFLPKLSIGINSGEVISGNIGSAALKRLDFTVIGDAVNTAQRLQSAAEPGQIVISKEIYETIKHAFECREVGEIRVKNKANPIVIYEVLD
jgi:adenylate cyclase